MNRLTPWSALPLRLMIAVSFLVHGLPKFTPVGHEMFVGMLESIGVPAPGLMAWITPVVEVTGALLVLVGAFTRISAAALVPVMVMAMVKVHLPNGFSWMNVTGMTEQGPTFGIPGAELSLLYLAILAALVIGGAGPLSVDARRPTQTQ